MRGESRQERALQAHVAEDARQQVHDVHEIHERRDAHQPDAHVLHDRNQKLNTVQYSTVEKGAANKMERREVKRKWQSASTAQYSTVQLRRTYGERSARRRRPHGVERVVHELNASARSTPERRNMNMNMYSTLTVLSLQYLIVHTVCLHVCVYSCSVDVDTSVDCRLL